MKRRKQRSNRMEITQLWTRSDAVKAIPYLRSIIASLREYWLEVTKAERQLKLANQKPGVNGRQQILDHETQEDDLVRARNKFNDALEELTRIEVFLLDPVQGLALIPFRREDDLAWFVFDLFAKDGIVGWRLHEDPIEACRSLGLLEDAATPLTS